MGWSGGTFSRVHDWTDDETAGLNIEASRMDAEDDNFETGINSCLHKGGQNTATGNLPMGGYIHTGVGNGTARNHYAALGQVQDSSTVYASAGGSANTLTLTLSPAITAYAAGQTFTFKASASNTGSATLNVNALGAKGLRYQGSALTGAEVINGAVYTVVYDGTYFQLLNISNYAGCVATDSGGQAVTALDSHKIEFGGEEIDYGGLHSTVTNTSRFTVPRTGLYACTLYIGVDGSNTDVRYLQITVNGNTKYFDHTVPAEISPVRLSCSGIVYATAGQYIEFVLVNFNNSESIDNARAAVVLLPY